MEKQTMHAASAAFLILAIWAGAPGAGAESKKKPPTALTALYQLGHRMQRSEVTPGGDEYNPGYSWVDLEEFRKHNQLAGIVDNFRNDPAFKKGVAVLRTRPKGERQAALAKLRVPLDATWFETKEVGNGTTDAGRQAELEIGRALARAVAEELARKP